MDAPGSTETAVQGSIDAVAMLRAAADARKCWACGCLRHTLDTIDRARPPPGLNDALDLRSILHASASCRSGMNAWVATPASRQSP